MLGGVHLGHNFLQLGLGCTSVPVGSCNALLHAKHFILSFSPCLDNALCIFLCSAVVAYSIQGRSQHAQLLYLPAARALSRVPLPRVYLSSVWTNSCEQMLTCWESSLAPASAEGALRRGCVPLRLRSGSLKLSLSLPRLLLWPASPSPVSSAGPLQTWWRDRCCILRLSLQCLSTCWRIVTVQ